MADPALGKGLTVTSEGDLTLKGVREQDWNTGWGSIDTTNGLKVDPTTGNAWVRPAPRGFQSIIGDGGALYSPGWDTSRYPEGLYTHTVAYPGANFSDAGNIATYRPVSAGASFSWTNPSAVNYVDFKITASGVFGSIIAAAGPGGIGPTASMSCGLMLALTVNGVLTNHHVEYHASSLGDSSSGGIAGLSRTFAFTLTPSGTLTVSCQTYFRSVFYSTPANSGGNMFWRDSFLFIDARQQAAFTDGTF